MARIRSIHPGFFRDDKLVSCSAFARLLFIGLGVEADDKGIFEWKPLTLKMSIFPGDNIEIDVLLDELARADAIKRFEVGGRAYGAIRNFRKYQRPKTPNDLYPMPDDIAEYVAFPQKGETATVQQTPFLQKGEISPQMEDGGGKRKEERKNAASGASDEIELFRRGKEVLGTSAGGMIRRLLTAKGENIPLARAAVEMASTKQNPREYIGAILNKRDGPDDLRARGEAW